MGNINSIKKPLLKMRVNLTMKKRVNKNTHRFLQKKKNRETTRGKKLLHTLFSFFIPPTLHFSFIFSKKNSCCNLTRFFFKERNIFLFPNRLNIIIYCDAILYLPPPVF